MLTIRLSRVGKKKQAEYRLIINEKTKDPWGDVLEYLGYYNPRSNPVKVDLKVDRIEYWISQGAQMSDTVKNLLIDQKVITGDKTRPHGLQVRKKDSEKKEEGKEEKSAPTESDKEVEVEKKEVVDAKAEPKKEEKK